MNDDLNWKKDAGGTYRACVRGLEIRAFKKGIHWTYSAHGWAPGHEKDFDESVMTNTLKNAQHFAQEYARRVQLPPEPAKKPPFSSGDKFVGRGGGQSVWTVISYDEEQKRILAHLGTDVRWFNLNAVERVDLAPVLEFK